MEISEKEIKIFSAVFSLAQKGRNLSSIKVQEIADEANMGKGTLYEYFTSKEEIIKKTMSYYMNLEVQKFVGILNGEDSFVGIIKGAFNAMGLCDKQYSSFQVLFSNTEKGGPDQFISKNKEILSYVIPQVVDLIDSLIQIGIKEGIVDANIDSSYARFVVLGAIASYNLCLRSHNVLENSSNLDKAQENAINLIINGLAKK